MSARVEVPLAAFVPACTSMYRHAPEATVERSWLWHHPLRIAAAAYALGTVASTASLGLTAVLEEQSAGRARLA